MVKEVEWHNGIVRALGDIEGTPIKAGHVGLVTAYLPHGYDDSPVFAVYFNKEDVGDVPWFTFKDMNIEDKFELLEGE